MRCLTVGSLVGDKLLALAKGSIGMEDESDYPKQIYDIDALLESTKISEKTVNQMVTSINSLTKIEAGYRNIEITPVEALDDVIATMNEYLLTFSIIQVLTYHISSNTMPKKIRSEKISSVWILMEVTRYPNTCLYQ